MIDIHTSIIVDLCSKLTRACSEVKLYEATISLFNRGQNKVQYLKVKIRLVQFSERINTTTSLDF